jgi:hypothetical protein
MLICTVSYELFNSLSWRVHIGSNWSGFGLLREWGCYVGYMEQLMLFIIRRIATPTLLLPNAYPMQLMLKAPPLVTMSMVTSQAI